MPKEITLVAEYFTKDSGSCLQDDVAVNTFKGGNRK